MKNVTKLGIVAILAAAMLLNACSGATIVVTESVSPAAASDDVGAQASHVMAENTAVTTEDVPVVYFTPEITPESLVAVYQMAEWTPVAPVAVKVSTGESESSNYLRPELIADLVHEVDGTIVECNTAYNGNRSSTEEHLRLAEEHGFTQIAPVVIQDADGTIAIPVNGGTRLTEDLVGAAFPNYNSYLVLSHFKGHSMAGYGGAIKNMAIGIASADGKALIHSGGTSIDSPWGGEQSAFLESMAEAATAVADYEGDHIVYVNVMNRLSVDCDCDAHPAEPDMHDIGILASTDPVALDQACIDLVYGAPDSTSLVERIESRDGLHTLEYAEKIGLGSRAYELVDIGPTAPEQS